MQLILESDTVIDVKSNMSADDDMQHDKMDCLDLKYNNKNLDIKQSTGIKDRVLSDIGDDIANKETNVVNIEEDDALITDPSYGSSNHVHDEQSISKESMETLSSLQEINGCVIEKEVNNKSEEILDEDFLEDDIISIRDESFHVTNNIEKVITDNNVELLEENLLSDKDVHKEKEVILVSEQKDTADMQVEMQTDNPVENETQIIEIAKPNSIIPREKETEILLKDKTEEIVTTAQPGEETRALVEEKNYDKNTIDQIELTTDQRIKERDTEILDQTDEDLLKKTEHSKCQAEKKIETQMHEITKNIKIGEEIVQGNELCAEKTEIQAQDEMEVIKFVNENELDKEKCEGETNVKAEKQIEQVQITVETPLADTQFNEKVETQEKMEIVATPEEEMEVVESIEKAELPTIPCEKDKEVEIMEFSDCTEITEQVPSTETVNICTQETEPKSPSIEIISEGIGLNENEDSFAQSKEASISIKSDQNGKTDTILFCENSVNLLEDKEMLVACDETKSSAEENQVTRGKIDLDKTNEANCSTERSESKCDRDETDSEINANTENTPGQCKSQTGLSTEKESTTDENITSKATDDNVTSNSSEIQTEKSNTDSPTVIDSIDVLQTNSSPVNINMNIDGIDETKNKEELGDVNDVSSKTINTVEKASSKDSNTTVNNKDTFIACKSSYTLDIFSDEEDLPEAEPPKVETPVIVKEKAKQCINIEDDDDIMLIDEDNSKTDKETQSDTVDKNEIPKTAITDTEIEKPIQDSSDVSNKSDQQEITTPVIEAKDTVQEIDINEKANKNIVEDTKELSALLPENFLSTAKTKLADMTRDALEEFCVLKIVESIVDRSSLSNIKNKLKEMTQGLEDYRKKAGMLSKQNRDLQVVLKSVQEEQKKVNRDTPITPLKITRSVGVQVYMEKAAPRKKTTPPNINKNNNTLNKNATPQGRVAAPTKVANQNIPVPRLVPANGPALKTPSTIPQINTPSKNTTPSNGIIRNPSPSLKPEKRPHNKIASSETVDLTDDEPPAKMPGGPKNATTPPVRLVPSQNLMAPQRQPFPQSINSPRKVYIPISGPPNQALRPGQTIMLKSVPTSGMRTRCPTPQRMESMRVNRILTRHPAPLPFAMKQYQPPNWKSLPPAPDLKLSKVENGIVISWKIEDVPEDSYEEIASYQLYAYQETNLPASTALWKKIGDVKALPLPMACTLTQFMAGFKYYFAVRAVDIRSRLGPFSLPGSILLLNKNILD